MPDTRVLQTSRELFLATLAGGNNMAETWVLDRMISLLEEDEARAGQRLFEAGEPNDFIYFMRDGKVRLTREGTAPWIFEGRWAIGALDILVDRPHNRTATALTDIQLLKVRADRWIDLLEDSFDLARNMLMNVGRGCAKLELQRWTTIAPQKEGRIVVSSMPAVSGPLTFVDRLAILTETMMLKNAGVQVLTDAIDVTEEVTFEAGSYIRRRGEPPKNAYLLIEGEVQASHVQPDVTVHFGPGSVVCGAAPLNEAVLPWEARAITKARALAINVEDWLDLMEVHFDLVRSALRGLSLVRESILEELADAKGVLVLR